MLHQVVLVGVADDVQLLGRVFLGAALEDFSQIGRGIVKVLGIEGHHDDVRMNGRIGDGIAVVHQKSLIVRDDPVIRAILTAAHELIALRLFQVFNNPRILIQKAHFPVLGRIKDFTQKALAQFACADNQYVSHFFLLSA